MTTYKVTKEFTSGNLEGLTYTETTTVKYEVGKEYKGLLGTSDYRITEVEKIA